MGASLRASVGPFTTFVEESSALCTSDHATDAGTCCPSLSLFHAKTAPPLLDQELFPVSSAVVI
jgi:hypothetical protein